MISEARTYEAILEQFGSDKRLARLTRYVRAPKGGRCDACGSTLPRILFGLKEVRTQRYYFVGENCLARLLEAGTVARARYRESAKIAYVREMELRNQEGRPSPSDPEAETTQGIVLETGTVLAQAEASVTPQANDRRWIRRDGALILENAAPRADAILVVIAVSLRFPDEADGW